MKHFETIAAALVLIAVAAFRAPVSAAVPGDGVVRDGIAVVPVRVAGGVLRALVDTGGYELVDPNAVARRGLRTGIVRIRGRERRVVTTADGAVMLVARPDAFETTFLQTPEATISLSSLRTRVATLDYRGGTVTFGVPPGHADVVRLFVRAGPPPAARLPGQAFAALEVTVAGERALWLLDTGAQARFVGDARVSQVSAVDARVAERWHRAHPEWPYGRDAATYAGEDGDVRVDAIRVPLRVGTQPVRQVWCVVRHEDQSFDYLSRALGRPVVGDAGAGAFGAVRLSIDLARERLEIR